MIISNWLYKVEVTYRNLQNIVVLLCTSIFAENVCDLHNTCTRKFENGTVPFYKSIPALVARSHFLLLYKSTPALVARSHFLLLSSSKVGNSSFSPGHTQTTPRELIGLCHRSTHHECTLGKGRRNRHSDNGWREAEWRGECYYQSADPLTNFLPIIEKGCKMR